jgi:hypothetical protein
LYRPPPPPPPATIITFAVSPPDGGAKVYVVFDVVEDPGVIVPIDALVYTGVSA